MTDVDSQAFDPAMRAVLDWLARHEVRVYDFAEVAEAAGLKRGVCEAAFVRLRHERAGKALADRTPEGTPLPMRSAYLPANSPHRAGHAGKLAALPPPVNPLEAHAQRRRDKKAAKDARRQSEAATLLAARVAEKRGEKDARKAAQMAVRERLLTPKETPTPAAAAPLPPRKPAVTPKEAPRG